MGWSSWGLVLAASLAAGILGAFLFLRGSTLLRMAASFLPRLRQMGPKLRRTPPQPAVPAPAPKASGCPSEEVVLIPDGRPWPLGPALQLLELAWRWQVVHGANLPLRARQGEGAYVWRPPLPSRSASDQQGAEAEH